MLLWVKRRYHGSSLERGGQPGRRRIFSDVIKSAAGGPTNPESLFKPGSVFADDEFERSGAAIVCENGGGVKGE
jgi:hypothetical protein